MGFLSIEWLGVKLWIWLYFLLSFLLGMCVAVYWHRERIRRRYYEIRFPEKIIKVIIHYKSKYFKEFYRLIPDDKIFIIRGKDYYYNNENILRDNDFFVKKNKEPNKTTVKVDGFEYVINNLFKIRKKKRDYPELHYFYNVPQPIDFSYKNKDITLSSKQLAQFKENELFSKLLTMDTERNIFFILIVVMVINLLVTVVMLAKMMEWIK